MVITEEGKYPTELWLRLLCLCPVWLLLFGGIGVHVAQTETPSPFDPYISYRKQVIPDTGQLYSDWILYRLPQRLQIGFGVIPADPTGSSSSSRLFEKAWNDRNHAELSQDSDGSPEASPAQNDGKARTSPVRALLWFILKWTIIIFGAWIAFLFLLRVLVKIYEWLTADSRKRLSLIVRLTVLFGLLVIIYFLPRSQSTILNSWESTSRVRESSFFLDKVFGASPNHYDTDVNGRITALYLKDAGLHDLQQLPGIESLSSLQYLDISDSPLQGTIDLSPFTALKELHLRNTKVDKIVGLDKLTALNRLDLAGSPVEEIDPVAAAVEWFDFSRTRITDLAPLSRLREIKELSLEGMDLDHMRGLEDLPPVSLISFRESRHIRLERLKDVGTLILDKSDVTDLSGLARLPNLVMLSIFDTNVKSLEGLENTNIALINTDNPEFTAEKLEQVFHRKIATWHINLSASLFSSLFPETIWHTGKMIGAALCIILIFLLSPTPFAWQMRWLLRVKQIGRFMVPGAFLVLFLWMIANITIPSSAGTETWEEIARIISIQAVVTGGAWLLLMPMLMVLIDTRTLGQSALSAPVAMFLWLFSWWLRPLLILGLPLVLFGYSYWYTENTGPTGALFLILLIIIGIVLPITFALIGLTLIRKTRIETRSKLLYKLSVPAACGALSIGLSIFLIIYLSLRPEGLDNVPSATVMVMGLCFLALICAAIGLQLIDTGIAWSRRRQQIASVLNGETIEEAVIEVPFRQHHFEFPLVSVVNIVWTTIFTSTGQDHLNVINAHDAGQATSVFPTKEKWKALAGVVVMIQRQDLRRSKEWEFISLCGWIKEIYKTTWSPIWITGDWIGELMPGNTSIDRKLEMLDSLGPFISGLENISAPAGSIFGTNPPDNINSCLHVNRVIDSKRLLDLGLPELSQNAPTPLATMLRSIFSQPDPANRLDLAVRCVEMAVSMISLVFASEYEFENVHNRRIEKALAQFLPKPTFKSWTSLFDTFVKNSGSEFVRLASQDLDKPSVPEAQELRTMVETVGGANALNSVVAEIGSVRDTLALLVASRNVITAHGPTVESAANDLYRAAFLVSLDLLASLRWSTFTFQASLGDGRRIRFKGCVPEFENDAMNLETGKVFVSFSGWENGRLIDASRFFRFDERTISLAVYAEEDRFVEPASGSYLDLGRFRGD